MPSAETDVVIVLTTMPAGLGEAAAGDTLARTLVDERLAACVSLLAPMTSVYRWQGEVETAVEQQLVIKTARARVPALETRLRQLHPYDLPELLVLEAGGASAYLAWVAAETGATSS
jgi:periplasmic divalent cation tolerance protein